MALAGCGADMSLDGKPLIACHGKDECPAGYACSLEVGLCIATDAATESGPVLQAATARSPFDVLLTFSERLSSTAATDPANYAITPELTIDDAQLLDDGAHIQLVVSEQRPELSYTVTASDLTDLLGNPMATADASQDFVGFGTADESQPGFVAPDDHATVTTDQVLLVWESRLGAHHYTLEVSTSPDFSTALAGTPWHTDTTNAVVSVSEPVTHYWRVSSDLTSDTPSEVRTFEPLLSTAYVYCPPDAPCDPPFENSDVFESGTRSHPFRKLSRAIDAVANAPLGEAVLVASRGDQVYEDQLRVVPGIDVTGGYDDTFLGDPDGEARPTRVRAATGMSLVAAAITDAPTTIAHLEFIAAPSAANVAAGRLFACSNALTLSHDRFTTESSLAVYDARALDVIGAVGTDEDLEPGPLLSHLRIDVPDAMSASMALHSQDAFFTLEDSQVSAQSPSGQVTVAMAVESANSSYVVRVRRSQLIAGPSQISLGLGVTNMALYAEQATIMSGPADVASEALTVHGGGVEVRHSRVHAGAAGNLSTGADVQGGTLNLYDSIVSSAEATSGINETSSVALRITATQDQTAYVDAAFNTLIVAPITASSAVVTSQSNPETGGNIIMLINNLLVGASGSPVGIYEGDTMSDIRAVLNNAWGGVSPAVLNENTFALADLNDLNHEPLDDGFCSGDCKEVQASGNFPMTSLNLDEVFVDPDGADNDLTTPLDNDWHLKLLTDPDGIAGAGRVLDGTGSDCGAIDELWFCATVPDDFDGHERTPPFSVGAYEK
jgi:hypothetical protein